MPYSELRKGRDSIPGQIYLVTTVTHQRIPWFLDFTHARGVIAQMCLLHGEGWVESLAWVLMPDHLHWLLTLQPGYELRGVVGRLKGRSARQINLSLGRSGRIWQQSFHDHALRREEDLVDVARYVVANPLRAGLVDRLGDYPHWDAKWL
ncbi:REP-associated tyrosine transposase [Thioalkalivibrio sulfidiphilus]|uniref:Transposase IS200-like domain-containing protein n=1 Tax=Thioalkalivibrio sulfidiphilus (strain HL-EbGR7) TaxID=396588 RepID=B8GNG0_THISH|nr:transposase [Thioalkalivibrio sulfidiphilus]ACL73851.1 conserved hypothetical protein [Thioalkalivibrio sulfidiphilus HL-EbGr7]